MYRSPVKNLPAASSASVVPIKAPADFVQTHESGPPVMGSLDITGKSLITGQLPVPTGQKPVKPGKPPAKPRRKSRKAVVTTDTDSSVERSRSRSESDSETTDSSPDDKRHHRSKWSRSRFPHRAKHTGKSRRHRRSPSYSKRNDRRAGETGSYSPNRSQPVTGGHPAAAAVDMTGVLAALQLQQQQWQALQAESVNQQLKLMMNQMSGNTGAKSMVNPNTGPSCTVSSPPVSNLVQHNTQDETFVASDDEDAISLFPSHSLSDSHKASDDESQLGSGLDDEPRDISPVKTTPSSVSEREAYNSTFNLMFPDLARKQRRQYRQVIDFGVNQDQRSKDDTALWDVPPALSQALANSAGYLQNNKGDPVDTPLVDTSVKPSSISYFKVSNVVGKDEFRVRMDPEAEFQPTPPDFCTYWPQYQIPNKFVVDARWLHNTDELCRRSAIAVGQMERATRTMLSLVEGSEAEVSKSKDWAPLKQVMASALLNAQRLTVASAANFSLVKRDHLLHMIGLPSSDGKRARTAPFTGSELSGPNNSAFTQFLATKRSEELASGGKQQYFDTPSAFVPTVPQPKKDSNKSAPFQGRSNSGRGRSRPTPQGPTSSGPRGRGGRRGGAKPQRGTGTRGRGGRKTSTTGASGNRGEAGSSKQ